MCRNFSLAVAVRELNTRGLTAIGSPKLRAATRKRPGSSISLTLFGRVKSAGPTIPLGGSRVPLALPVRIDALKHPAAAVHKGQRNDRLLPGSSSCLRCVGALRYHTDRLTCGRRVGA